MLGLAGPAGRQPLPLERVLHLALASCGSACLCQRQSIVPWWEQQPRLVPWQDLIDEDDFCQPRKAPRKRKAAAAALPEPAPAHAAGDADAGADVALPADAAGTAPGAQQLPGAAGSGDSAVKEPAPAAAGVAVPADGSGVLATPMGAAGACGTCPPGGLEAGQQEPVPVGPVDGTVLDSCDAAAAPAAPAALVAAGGPSAAPGGAPAPVPHGQPGAAQAHGRRPPDAATLAGVAALFGGAIGAPAVARPPQDAPLPGPGPAPGPAAAEAAACVAAAPQPVAAGLPAAAGAQVGNPNPPPKRRGRPPGSGAKRKAALEAGAGGHSAINSAEAGAEGAPAHEHAAAANGRPARRAASATASYAAAEGDGGEAGERAAYDDGFDRLLGCTKCRYLKNGCGACRERPVVERAKVHPGLHNTIVAIYR